MLSGEQRNSHGSTEEHRRRSFEQQPRISTGQSIPTIEEHRGNGDQTDQSTTDASPNVTLVEDTNTSRNPRGSTVEEAKPRNYGQSLDMDKEGISHLSSLPRREGKNHKFFSPFLHHTATNNSNNDNKHKSNDKMNRQAVAELDYSLSANHPNEDTFEISIGGDLEAYPEQITRQNSFYHTKRGSIEILEEKLPKAFRLKEEAIDKLYRSTVHRRIKLKNLIIACGAEFCGTFLFLLFALGIATVVSNRKDLLNQSQPEGVTDLEALLYSSLGFGFSLCITVWVFFRISGGMQNPTITFALYLAGAMDLTKCVLLSFTQYIAGITAAAVVSALLPGAVNARTTLSEGMTEAQGFFLEFFLDVLFIFAVYMLAAEKHRGTFLAPIGIGLALFVTQLFGQNFTGASVNPARTLGPDVVTIQFETYCWIYYLAPYLAAIGVYAFYFLLKWLRYETAAEGQDADETRAGDMKQVFKDTQGNIIGTMETLLASNLHSVTQNDEDVEEGLKRPRAASIVTATPTTTGVRSPKLGRTQSFRSAQSLQVPPHNVLSSANAPPVPPLSFHQGQHSPDTTTPKEHLTNMPDAAVPSNRNTTTEPQHHHQIFGRRPSAASQQPRYPSEYYTMTPQNPFKSANTTSIHPD